MEEIIGVWYKKLWETKGSRFIAAHRFEMYDRRTTLTISILSVYIIILGLVVLLPNHESFFPDTTNAFVSIGLSAGILVISTIISGRDYRLKSQKYHDCGKAISELYDKIVLWKNFPNDVSKNDIVGLIQDYNYLLDKYDLNHSHNDYLLFKAQNISEYKSIKCPIIFKFRMVLQYKYDTLIKYWLFIIAPPVIFFMLIKLH